MAREIDYPKRIQRVPIGALAGLYAFLEK